MLYRRGGERATQYTQLPGLGPEWQVLGVGDYNGTSQAEFLMRNSNNGALVIGAVSGDNVTFSTVGGVGAEWNFHTTHVATVS